MEVMFQSLKTEAFCKDKKRAITGLKWYNNIQESYRNRQNIFHTHVNFHREIAFTSYLKRKSYMHLQIGSIKDCAN
jgi:hypothetical protein